jgi:putative endonuclease
MAEHNDLGKQAEELAVNWLIEKGFEILHRNWHHGKLEIDIIARKETILHIIEVKARQSHRYGYPEESVSRKKFKKLQRAADAFLHRNPGNPWMQYDILSITIFCAEKVEYFLLEDVFL